MIGHSRSIWPGRPVAFVRCALGVILIAAVAAMLPGVAFSQSPISITACGKIAKAGLYELDSNLVASEPASGDCLVITAANVSLNLNRFNLYGATSDVGIHVMKSASRVFIEGSGSTIETFGVGIQIDATGALVDNFTVLSNTDAGVFLNRVTQADLSNFVAMNNKNDGVRINGGSNNVLQMPTIQGSGRYGIWILSSSHNSIGNFTVQDNTVAGIYVGCSIAGPRGTCARGTTASSYNYMFSGIAGIFSSGVQQYGVAIGLGDKFNRVVNVQAQQNNELDLLDMNTDCGSDYWFAETEFGAVAPQSCIN
jgi:parallel beta-helix repeat protein